MKGIIFSEFLDMVDEKFSIEMSERLIDEAKPPSGGAYTTVGTYDPQEIVDLVAKLSEFTSISVPDLLKTFGRHLLSRFTKIFPDFFEGVSSTLDFLPMVDSYVHLEVKKLYGDAELPSFTCVSPYPGRLEMIYRSARNLPDLAEGLILGTADYLNERLEVKRESIPEDPSAELFIVTKLQD
jgi:Haem-NO-binding